MEPDKQRFGFVSGFIQSVVIGDSVAGFELRFFVFIHCRGFARGFFVDRYTGQRVAFRFQLLSFGYRESQGIGICPGVVAGFSRKIQRVAAVQFGFKLQGDVFGCLVCFLAFVICQVCLSDSQVILFGLLIVGFHSFFHLERVFGHTVNGSIQSQCDLIHTSAPVITADVVGIGTRCFGWFFFGSGRSCGAGSQRKSKQTGSGLQKESGS